MSGAAGQLYLGSELRTVLDARGEADEALKDEYVSGEHYLLALAESSAPAARLLKDSGVTHARLLQALQQVRG